VSSNPLGLQEGQQVWVGVRPAIFVCLHPSGEAAVVRYPGERLARVVPLRKLRVLPGQGA
jgi:hypothetical protein